MKRKIIIGSRGSDLALWQARFVMAELKKIDVETDLQIIRTQGDRIQDLSFDKLEGKGFFTKEIEEALLNRSIDLAVHSHKDLPTTSPQGLMIAAVSEREDPSELLLFRKECIDKSRKFSLSSGASVGTSSARRKSQILAWRNDVRIEELRGNVPTRIQKLRDGKYDAILIAGAGVSRLGIDLSEFHVEKLDPSEFIPAPAQGVLALQIRQDDQELADVLKKLNKPDVALRIGIERKVLNLFDGGCQLPLGVYCIQDENEKGEERFRLHVAKADAWNKFPKYISFESRKPEGMAQRAVAAIQGMKPATVFITRDEKKNDFFKNCLEANGFHVKSRSLIEIRQIPLRDFKKTEWIFFASKNAVRHFFDQHPNVEGVRIGAIGRSTAEAIQKYGRRADFIGNDADTAMTGKKFAAMVGNRTVLFPRAKESARSIQQHLPKKEHVTDVIVYETLQHAAQLQFDTPPEVMVFTSPSNVASFLAQYKVEPGQKIIAMGGATASALKRSGIQTDKQPFSFDDLGLVRAVMSLSIHSL